MQCSYRLFLEKLIKQAAPVLMNLKPASLICFPKRTCGNILPYLDVLNQEVKAKGIYVLDFGLCKESQRLFVFRASLLSQHLEKKSSQAILAQYGYAEFTGLWQKVKHLKKRLVQGLNFPHEIGVFLGYPVQDVAEFIRQNGQNSCLVGYWKVYGNIQEAKKTFAHYDRCREYLLTCFRYKTSLSALNLA